MESEGNWNKGTHGRSRDRPGSREGSGRRGWKEEQERDRNLTLMGSIYSQVNVVTVEKRQSSLDTEQWRSHLQPVRRAAGRCRDVSGQLQAVGEATLLWGAASRMPSQQWGTDEVGQASLWGKVFTPAAPSFQATARALREY